MRSILVLGLAAAPLAPLATQVEDAAGGEHTSVDEVLENAHEVYGVPVPDVDCGAEDNPSNVGAIVVCGSKPDNSRYRVKSTAELDPKSKAALDDGLPRAPDLGPPPCIPSLSSLCIKFGSHPPHIHLIDLSKIPLPPPGSDADRISKGEIPAP